nr:bifunctional DNA primase/polymerase [Streptomonospora sp. PA3]
MISRGLPVFPADHPATARCTGIGRGHDPTECADRGKHPCVPFSRTYTSDEREAFRWFDGRHRNVAVAVGAARGPSGERLVVVDSDRPGALEAAAADLGEQHAPTMRVTTAKGHHDYYWAPADADLGNGLGALRGHLDGDVRAGRAYVIGPGSVHATGVLYRVAEDRPIAAAPGWLVAALQAAPRSTDRSGVTTVTAPPGRRLLALVRFVLESRQGERNARLYWAACRAFESLDDVGERSAAAAALTDAATAVGLPEGESRKTIDSAYRKAAR